MKKLFVIAAVALMGLTASAQDLKFAHVNSQEILYVLPDYVKATSEMMAAQKDAQGLLDEMLDELQKKGSAFEKNEATWSQSIRESKAKELQDLQQRIQDFQQSTQQELQQLQQQKMAPLQKSVQDAIDKTAKEGGFVFVFEKASLVYVDETKSTDITPMVRVALSIPESRTIEDVDAEVRAKAQELGLN